MKWQGGRQSANFIDLRNATSIDFIWQPNDATTKLQGVNLYITTAGAIFTSDGKSTIGKLTISASAVKIIVAYQVGIKPTVTAAQKNIIEDLLKKVSVGRDITITSNAGELQELATAIYRNLKG